MDFAKNRGINYQEEIKAAFYANSQITMHPIVNYYQKGDGLVKDVCIILSEDLCHDYHAVHFYKSLVDNHIKDQLNAAPVKQVIFSDGCSAQYKSQGLSLKKIQISRNLFGSEHGKSACDAEIGVLNRAVDQTIIGKKVAINNTKDLFEFCHEKLILDKPYTKRNFFFVKADEISRNQPETNVKPIPNTRKLHNIDQSKEPILILCKLCERNI